MIKCDYSPIEVQNYCRDRKLWPNKIAIRHFDDRIEMDIMLFASYKYTLPLEVIQRSFDTQDKVHNYVNEMKSMYPRIDIANYDYRKGEK